MTTFGLPNMVVSPYHKTAKAVIPDLPVDDSAYWLVKGGQALELVWSHLEEQASRMTKFAAFLNKLKLESGKKEDGTEYPASVSRKYGRFDGILSVCPPTPAGWMSIPLHEAFIRDGAPKCMKYWVPSDKPAGKEISDFLEQVRPLDPDRLQFALFGDAGYGTVRPGGAGLKITMATPHCFVHVAKRPVAVLRVNRNQSFAKMSTEVRTGLTEIPGSRFWRMVEVEHIAMRELQASLRKLKGKPKKR
jgi:hypothetical protein